MAGGRHSRQTSGDPERPTGHRGERGERRVDLRRQLAAVRAWWLLLVAGVVLASVVAFVVSSLQPKVYEAQTTLIVGQSLSSVNPDYTQLLASQRLSKTYASVATTRPLVENVIKQLGLTQTADELTQRVRADAPPDNTLLTITAQDGDPARAAAIANALAEQLIAASPALQGRQADVQQSIDADLKGTQAQIDETQAQIDRLSALPSPSPGEANQLETLRARLITLRSTYASLLAFSSTGASNLLSVVQPAVAPESPVSPRPFLNTLIAALVAAVVAVGIALLAERLDDRLKTSEDVQEATGLATLGAIPRMRSEKGRDEFYALAALLYPRSSAAEGYRTLRANLEFASLDVPIRTLLVTSASPGEGKTATAANLALVLAQAGRRVLLVDADLRKPGLHTMFRLSNERGITTLVRSDDVALPMVAHATEEKRLHVLSSGPVPGNPAELLGSQRMRTILARLQGQYDMLVLDSPPLSVVADPAILGSFLDATLLVVDAERSHRSQVRQARDALAKADARVLGTVLNRLPEHAFAGYSSYYGESQEAGTEPATATVRVSEG